MASNLNSKKSPSRSTIEGLFTKAQKAQRAVQEDYKNASGKKGKVPSAKDAKPELKSKEKPCKPSQAAGSKPNPAPSFNISSEFEKKEYFDSEGVLGEKIKQLAKWIRESHYCIMFTGAGVSTSTGIPDFRSGVNTVLPTGPGIWERKAKGVQLPSQKKKIQSVLQAFPSLSQCPSLSCKRKAWLNLLLARTRMACTGGLG